VRSIQAGFPFVPIRGGRRQLGHIDLRSHLRSLLPVSKLLLTYPERLCGRMNDRRSRRLLHFALSVGLVLVSAAPVVPAVKNWALVAPQGSKLQDVTLADLVKLCKGTQKSWPDGRSFTLVMHDPESLEMRGAVEKLFGVAPAEFKPLVAKLNESRAVIKIVENDEDIIRTVGIIPGAVGLVDVYAINSSVKVLRVDGKLPFDIGYTLKGN
jgi:hypothetical protein